MPSTATITSFYTFAAGTKARAAQVNANFSNFRGHIIPIDPNTVTGINNTYDLGSSEYRWRNNYVQQIDLQSNTSTGNDLKIVGETTSSSPAFVFKIAGIEVGRIGSNYTLSSSSGLFTQATTVAAQITNFALTITCYGGYGFPNEIRFIPSGENTVNSLQIISAGANGEAGILLNLVRNGTTIQQMQISECFGGAGGGNEVVEIPLTSIYFFDNSAPSGTVTYSVEMAKFHEAFSTTTADNVRVSHGKMLIKRF